MALFIALRWNSYEAPLTRDEGSFHYCARLLVESSTPDEHAFEQKPPMVIYSYALSNLLLSQFFWSARLLAYLFVALATVLLGYIARLEFGKGFALPAMWLMTPMVLLPGIDQFWASVEMFMLFPMLATVAIYCYSRQHGYDPSIGFWRRFSPSRRYFTNTPRCQCWRLHLSFGLLKCSKRRRTEVSSGDVSLLPLPERSLRRPLKSDVSWPMTAGGNSGNAPCVLTGLTLLQVSLGRKNWSLNSNFSGKAGGCFFWFRGRGYC